MSDRPLTIVRLDVQGFKRLTAVSITPRGEVVEIRGNNAQGKSSVLDAIEVALRGKKAAPENPVHSGAEKAEVRLDLGSLTIERTIQPSGTQALKIRSADPAQPSTQAALDALLGQISFDPYEFVRLKPREQAERLREAMGIDTAALDSKRASLYDERTLANREVTRLEGALVNTPFPDGPDEPVDVSALAEQLAEITRTMAENNAARVAAKEAGARLTSVEREVADLRERLAAAEQEHEKIREEFGAATAAVVALVDPNPAPIQAQLASATELNEIAAQRARRRELADNLATMMGESEHYSQQILEVDQAKEMLLASASFPIPGIGIDGDTVTLNGLPIEQASAAERLRFAVALGLALNPRIGVLLIRDGSLLDEQSMEIVASMAREAGAQVWIERVGKEGAGWLIEDGALVPAVS